MPKTRWWESPFLNQIAGGLLAVLGGFVAASVAANTQLEAAKLAAETEVATARTEAETQLKLAERAEKVQASDRQKAVLKTFMVQCVEMTAGAQRLGQEDPLGQNVDLRKAWYEKRAAYVLAALEVATEFPQVDVKVPVNWLPPGASEEEEHFPDPYGRPMTVGPGGGFSGMTAMKVSPDQQAVKADCERTVETLLKIFRAK